MTDVRTAEPHVRTAQPGDASALARLRADSMIELGYLAPPQRAAFERDAESHFARLLAADRLVARVLCVGDAVVGSACAIFFERLPFPDGTLHAEVAGVYVAPGYRRAGHATRLVDAVVTAVQTSGARRTFLRPSPGTKPLYERLGFTDDDGGWMRL